MCKICKVITYVKPPLIYHIEIETKFLINYFSRLKIKYNSDICFGAVVDMMKRWVL